MKFRPGSGPREQAIVPNLHPSTTYALRMLAVNDIASSPFTEPVMAKTQEEGTTLCIYIQVQKIYV